MKKGNKKWLIVVLSALATVAVSAGVLSPELATDLVAEVVSGPQPAE